MNKKTMLKLKLRHKMTKKVSHCLRVSYRNSVFPRNDFGSGTLLKVKTDGFAFPNLIYWLFI